MFDLELIRNHRLASYAKQLTEAKATNRKAHWNMSGTACITWTAWMINTGVHTRSRALLPMELVHDPVEES